MSDRTLRLRSFSELTAHTVQLDVFVFQVQNSLFSHSPVWPSQNTNFSMRRFLEPGCAAGQPPFLPLAPSVSSFGFPLKPSLAPGLWQCGALQQTLLIQPLPAALGLGAQPCPPAVPEPPWAPLESGCLQTCWIICDRNSSKKAFKTPSDPGNVLGTSFLL